MYKACLSVTLSLLNMPRAWSTLADAEPGNVKPRTQAGGCSWSSGTMRLVLRRAYV